jgi:hypothetical protein
MRANQSERLRRSKEFEVGQNRWRPPADLPVPAAAYARRSSVPSFRWMASCGMRATSNISTMISGRCCNSFICQPRRSRIICVVHSLF